jgi:hypothetical protein
MRLAGGVAGLKLNHHSATFELFVLDFGFELTEYLLTFWEQQALLDTCTVKGLFGPLKEWNRASSLLASFHESLNLNKVFRESRSVQSARHWCMLQAFISSWDWFKPMYASFQDV